MPKFTGAPNVKPARTGDRSGPTRKQRAGTNVTTLGIPNSFISHHPF